MQKGFAETICTAKLQQQPPPSSTSSAAAATTTVPAKAGERAAAATNERGGAGITLSYRRTNDRNHDYANTATCLPAAPRDRANVKGADSATTSLSTPTATGSNFSQHQVDEDEAAAAGEFVVHHVTYDKRKPQIATNDNEIKQIPKVDLATGSDYCFYTSGENTRCNCSGRRRATLSGLIELFEQKVSVEEPKKLDYNQFVAIPKVSAANKLPSALKQQQQQQQQQQRASRATRTTSISNLTVNKVNNHNISRKMRNIITPVKYHLSESDDDDDDDDDDADGADDDDDEPAKQQLDGERSTASRLAANSSRGSAPGAALHRIATKGIAVLPRPESRKLTRTNWQPATDGRRYDQKLAGGQRSKTIVAPNCSQQPKRVSSSSLAATRGPSIVKHQVSSSRRLLNQLARLRRLNEPSYRIKRPEKVEQVESLIEQLERATIEWEEDDQLFERAERRDWPRQYHERFSRPPEECEAYKRTISTKEQDLGCRYDVDSFEESAIARSHSSMQQSSSQMGQQQVRYVAAGPWSSSLGRPANKARPSAFADRYNDDLAVRRLSSRSPSASHSRLSLVLDPSADLQVDYSSGHQMSYLLCSNAYTPTIEGADWDAIDRRVRDDDLHYRNVKNKPDPHEPPFGIPRQPSLASAHSSASHYLRYQNNKGPSSSSMVCTCSCACNQHQQYSQSTYQNTEQALQKRADSRVSFLERVSAGDRSRYSGCTSADSGVAGGGTPLSMGDRQSTLTRLTPSSPQNLSRTMRTPQSEHQQDSPVNQQQSDLEYVDTEDIELDLDLKKVSQDEIEYLSNKWSPSESPALERYKAEIRATPVKRRTKINIENPRAKSPLLRVSRRPVDSPSSPIDLPMDKGVVQVQTYNDTIHRSSSMRKPVSELECLHNFLDDSEDLEEDLKVRRIVTTNLDSTDSSPNESSIERYNYRGTNTVSKSVSDRKGGAKQDDKGKPLFSIGEYKPLNKPNLKIL